MNVPLEPGTGEGAWLAAVRALLPELAAAFGPDLIVSQHGADSHAWDPLAHLRVTTTAMGEAARLVDAVAHRFAGGRWLATGGGGYDVYRVVPRMWSLVWLAGAHREVPDAHARGVARAMGGGRGTLRAVAAPRAVRRRPERRGAARRLADGGRDAFDRDGRAGPPARRAAAAARGAGSRLVGSARRRGRRPGAVRVADRRRATPTIVESVDAATWDALTLSPGVIAPSSAADGHALVAAGLRDGLRATVARRRARPWSAPRCRGPPTGRRGPTCSRSGSRPAGAGAVSRAPSSRHTSRPWIRPTATSPPRSRSPNATRSSRSTAASAATSPAGSSTAAGFEVDPGRRPGPVRRSGRASRRSCIGRDGGPVSASNPAASDIVDVRLLEAMRAGGCPVCAVRARSEKATMDAIINERVLDIGFRADLERKQGFCRRHVAELVPTDRRETGGILGSSMLLSAVIDRRIDVAARRRRARPPRTHARPTCPLARKRPPCIACTQGATAVETALARFADRSADAAWAEVLGGDRRSASTTSCCSVERAGSRPRVRAGRPAPARPVRGPAPPARRLRPPLEPRPASSS